MSNECNRFSVPIQCYCIVEPNKLMLQGTQHNTNIKMRACQLKALEMCETVAYRNRYQKFVHLANPLDQKEQVLASQKVPLYLEKSNKSISKIPRSTFHVISVYITTLYSSKIAQLRLKPSKPRKTGLSRQRDITENQSF